MSRTKRGWRTARAGLAGVFGFFFAASAGTPPAGAQDFGGRTITLMVPAVPGQPQYAYAQSVAQHLGQYIPGKPTLTVQSMSTTSTLGASIFAFGAMPTDGLHLYTPPPDLVIRQFQWPKDARYDASKFAWLGRSHRSNPVWMAAPESGIGKIGDLKRKPLTIVTGNGASLTYVIPKIVVGLLGLDRVDVLKMSGNLIGAMMAYPGTTSAVLPWSAWRAQTGDQAGTFLSGLRPLLQVGTDREANLKEIPRLSDLISPSDAPIARIVDSFGTIGFSLVAPPSTPAAMVTTLRQAYGDLNKDGRFVESLQKAGLGFAPADGKTLEDFLNQTIAEAPRGTTDRFQALLKRPDAPAKNGNSDNGTITAPTTTASVPEPEPSTASLPPVTVGRPGFEVYGFTGSPRPPAAGNGGRAPAAAAAAGTPRPASDSRRTSGGFLWNSWITSFTRPDDPPVEAIDKAPDSVDPGDTYIVAIDLAALSYRAQGLPTPVPTPVKDQFADFLKRQIAEGRSQIRIGYRVVAIGDEIELADEAPLQERLTLDIDRLAHPPSGEDIDRLTARVRHGARPIDALSERVAAATLRIPVKARKEGCGALGISFWDESFGTPIEHLVRMVPVTGATTVQPEDCYKPEQGPLRGGLATLLERLIVGAEADHGHVDAALHVFETEDKDHSVVVFVDGTRREANGMPPAYGWTTRTKLSAFLTHDLQGRINAARAKLKTNAASYAAVAEVLRLKLFTAGLQNQAHTRQAQAAARAMAAIRQHGNGPAPVMIARLLSDNELLYVPLKLLTLTTPPALDPSVTVVQPLPRERFVSGSTCVHPWFIGIPAEIRGLSDADDQAALETFAEKVDEERRTAGLGWLAPPIKTIQDLRAYLGGVAPYKTRKESEGVVLLAHHDDNDNLYYEDNTDSVIPEHLSRSFEPGSVAVLTACTILNAESNGNLVNNLNVLGVDAMIASPFSVDAGFGARFAMAFVKVLEDAKKHASKATVADLFARSVAEVTNHYRHETQEPYKAQMAAELILVGDRNLSLCTN